MIVLKIILGLTVVRGEKRGQAPQKELQKQLESPLFSITSGSHPCSPQPPVSTSDTKETTEAHHSQMFCGIKYPWRLLAALPSLSVLADLKC